MATACYLLAMEWGPHLLDGVALAAWMHGSGGEEATALALPPSVRDAISAKLAEWSALPTGARHARLREIASRLRPPVDPERAASRLPARALALLAAEVPGAVGEAWLRESPPPRPGFRPDADLLRFLRDSASRPPEEKE